MEMIEQPFVVPTFREVREEWEPGGPGLNIFC